MQPTPNPLINLAPIVAIFVIFYFLLIRPQQQQQKELEQMLNKNVWTPIDVRTLSPEQRGRVIRSSMFLKEKFLATGEFEKLKARLVAGGASKIKICISSIF